MSTFQTSFHGVARRVMILMMMADGLIEESEVAEIQKIYRQLSGEELSARGVTQEILKARADGRSITDFLSVLSGAMGADDKAKVVRAAYLIAVADGRFGTEEQVLLAEVGRALELSPEQVEATIANARF